MLKNYIQNIVRYVEKHIFFPNAAWQCRKQDDIFIFNSQS